MTDNFTNWSKRILTIEHLKLDINNPRFSYQSTEKMNQTQIVIYLIDNYDVYDLAKDIAYNGYMLGEEPVVCKENEAFVVLEGNRRIAACKVLLSPRKYLSSLRANIIEQANFKIEKMECHVAPNRIAANKLIYRRHNGIPVKRWSKISQDAYLNNLISIEHVNIEEINKELNVTPSEVRKALRRYNAHQLAIKLFQSFPFELKQIAQEDFPITNLERFYESEKGAQFLGLSFNSNGKIKRHILLKDFNERYIFIIREILNDRLNSRIFNGDKDKEEYFKIIGDLFSLNPENLPEAEFIEDEHESEVVEQNTSESQPSKNGKPNNGSSNTKLFGDVDWHTGINRIDSIYNSLQKVNHKSNLDMVAISFRCYLEMIVYQYLKKNEYISTICEIENEKINKENTKKYEKGKKYIIDKFTVAEEEIIENELRGVLNVFEKRDVNFSPNLSKMLQYIASSGASLPDQKQREALQHLLNQNSSIINLKGLNLLIHNENYNISVEELKTTSLNLLPLLKYINIELKNEE